MPHQHAQRRADAEHPGGGWTASRSPRRAAAGTGGKATPKSSDEGAAPSPPHTQGPSWLFIPPAPADVSRGGLSSTQLQSCSVVILGEGMGTWWPPQLPRPLASSRGREETAEPSWGWHKCSAPAVPLACPPCESGSSCGSN